MALKQMAMTHSIEFWLFALDQPFCLIEQARVLASFHPELSSSRWKKQDLKAVLEYASMKPCL
jgi:hypothetical protein